MKLRIKHIVVAVFALCILSACKKDTDDKAYNAALEKLIGKWTFVNATTNQRYSNADHLTTVSAEPGDYMDFTNGGKVNLRFFGVPDISKFTLIKNTHLVFDDVDKFDLKTLTATELVLYRKIIYSAAAYKEETYFLKK